MSDQPQVIYVKQSGNGFAVTALVLGLAGICLAGIAIGFMFGWLFGILAVTFGLIGRRKAKRDPQAGRKTMATWGVVLGILAFACGCWGYATVSNAFDDVEKSLNETSQSLDAQSRCIERAADADEMMDC